MPEMRLAAVADALRGWMGAPPRCDPRAHRRLGHRTGSWLYVQRLACWRRLCFECGALVGVSERKPRGA